jgi:Domain of unknown function (DUF4388)
MIQGTVESTGISGVLQIPTLSNSSGRLTVTNGDESADAEIFYKNGKVVHAELGEVTGPAAIIELMRWEAGRFEFDDQEINGIPTTIDVDLQYIILEAMRIIDEERALAEEKEKAEEAVDEETALLGKLGDAIKEMIEGSSVPIDATGVFNEEGRLVLYFGNANEKDRVENLAAACVAFVQTVMDIHGASFFSSAIFADSEGSVLIQAIRSGLGLIAVTKTEANTGALKLQINKVSRAFSD